MIESADAGISEINKIPSDTDLIRIATSSGIVEEQTQNQYGARLPKRIWLSHQLMKRVKQEMRGASEWEKEPRLDSVPISFLVETTLGVAALVAARTEPVIDAVVGAVLASVRRRARRASPRK